MILTNAKVIAAFLLFSFIVASIVYFTVKPFNMYAFTLTGSMLAPMEQLAKSKLQELNDANSMIAGQMLNYYQVEANTMGKIEEARRHDEMFWLLAGIFIFIVSVLFWTALTQVKKSGG